MPMTWTARALTEQEHEAVRATPAVTAALVEDEPPDRTRAIDLDTAWHGIHWLLTGTAYDTQTRAGQAIFGGEPIGADLGHGPAHLIEPATVAKIDTALARVTADDLAERIDVDAMLAAEIYPGFWGDLEVFDSWLLPSYRRLRKFYRRAARRDAAVLTAIL